MSSFLAGCHVLSPWLVVSNVSFPTVPEDDDTQWLFCATTNQTECILFDAVVVGYIMSILSSISFGSNPMIPPHKQLYCQHVVLGVCCCLPIPPPALLSVFIQCALLVNCCLRSYPAFAGCKPMFAGKTTISIVCFYPAFAGWNPKFVAHEPNMCWLFYHVLLVKTRISLVGKIPDKCHIFSGSFQPPQSCMLKPQLPWLKQSSLDDFSQVSLFSPMFFVVSASSHPWKPGSQAYRWVPLDLIRASAVQQGARFMSWLKSWEKILSMVIHGKSLEN